VKRDVCNNDPNKWEIACDSNELMLIPALFIVEVKVTAIKPLDIASH